MLNIFKKSRWFTRSRPDAAPEFDSTIGNAFVSYEERPLPGPSTGAMAYQTQTLAVTSPISSAIAHHMSMRVTQPSDVVAMPAETPLVVGLPAGGLRTQAQLDPASGFPTGQAYEMSNPPFPVLHG